jgi:hypothetical protein
LSIIAHYSEAFYFLGNNNELMTDDIQRQELSKTSPVKKAGYVAIAGTATALVLPFAFGINTFMWIADYIAQNWPQLIIIAGFAVWMGKSRMGG